VHESPRPWMLKAGLFIVSLCLGLSALWNSRQQFHQVEKIFVVFTAGIGVYLALWALLRERYLRMAHDDAEDVFFHHP